MSSARVSGRSRDIRSSVTREAGRASRPSFSYRDLPVPEDVSKPLSGNWSGEYGPFRLETMNGKLVVRVGDGAPPIPISYQGDSVFAAGEEDLVRSPIENGHAVWGFDYVGGLF
jgi:hypothetical protein